MNRRYGSLWGFVEELGVIEVVTLALTLWVYSYGYYLLSTILSFGLGIAIAYMAEGIRLRGGRPRPTLRSKLKPGFIEEFYVVEILAILSTFYFYSAGHYAFSAFFAFCLGIVMAYFYERMRGRAEGRHRKQ